MAEVRPHRDRCGSWACAVCAVVLGQHLKAKLERVLKRAAAEGLRPILISLTLDRSKWAGGPLQAWKRLGELRAVPRAVQAFADAQGIAFKQMYLSKMELQKAGWPHWHVLMLVPENHQILPIKGAMDPHWKWGFSNVKHRRGIDLTDYTCKGSMGEYACKEAGAGEDGIEALRVSQLPAKHVHWIMPSRGFWARWGEADWHDAEECTEYADEKCSAENLAESETELHADRVEWCGRSSVLTVTVNGRSWYHACPLPRRVLAGAIEECVTDGQIELRDDYCRYFPSGVLEQAEMTEREVVNMLIWLSEMTGDQHFEEIAESFEDWLREQQRPPLKALFSPNAQGANVGTCGRR